LRQKKNPFSTRYYHKETGSLLLAGSDDSFQEDETLYSEFAYSCFKSYLSRIKREFVFAIEKRAQFLCFIIKELLSWTLLILIP
jgi:hypothetical protein